VPGPAGFGSIDFLFCVGLALLVVPMSLAGRRVGRVRGAIFLSTYVAFVLLLISQQT